MLRITKKFRYTSFRYAFSQNFDCIHIIESDPDDSTSIKLHCELYFSSTELSMFRAGEKCIKFYEEHNFGTGPTCKREIAISRSRFRWIKKKRYVALIHLQQYCIRLYLEVFCTTCIRTATCSRLKKHWTLTKDAIVSKDLLKRARHFLKSTTYRPDVLFCQLFLDVCSFTSRLWWTQFMNTSFMNFMLKPFTSRENHLIDGFYRFKINHSVKQLKHRYFALVIQDFRNTAQK